jgi:hypothetical protein
MDFKIVSKNNLGVVTVLLLVVILSQAKFFNFLLDTALGRAILIVFILIISYMNKILGVVAVLFIIIMFNNSDIGYMEGFTSSKPMKNDVAAKYVAASEKAMTTNGAAEGHDIIGTESTIKRGKQSNTIPATKTVGLENFAPFSGSYSESYSSF